MTPDGAWARRILVGVDGSELSADALALADLLATSTGASLIVGSVYGSSHAFGELGTEHVAAAALAVVSSQIQQAHTVRRVRASSPAEGLRWLAGEEAADLIVVGSSHRSGVGRVRPGSVASLLMTHPPCAIAVAPRGLAQRHDLGLRVTGVGFDGSVESATALAAAESLALSAGGAMRVFCVVADEAAGTPSTQATLGALADVTRDLAPEVRALSVPLRGFPTTELVAHSDEVDLLVLGTRGAGRLRRAVLGSVVEGVLDHAACPVLVVPPIADAEVPAAVKLEEIPVLSQQMTSAQ